MASGLKNPKLMGILRSAGRICLDDTSGMEEDEQNSSQGSSTAGMFESYLEANMRLREKAEKLKTDIPAVFIALRKEETPFVAKLIALITVCYALSPIDLIPDFIPVLGYLDDVIILPALVALTVKLIPTEVFVTCQQEAKRLWENGKPTKWYFAIPVVVIWLFILYLAVRAIIR